MIIAKAITEVGFKWRKISQNYLPFKNYTEIKSRYYCTIKRKGLFDILINQYQEFESKNGIIEEYLFDKSLYNHKQEEQKKTEDSGVKVFAPTPNSMEMNNFTEEEIAN